MTAVNKEKRNKQLASLLDFSFNQFMKDIHTAIPALIVSYDSETRRAVVQPAINRILNDPPNESMTLPPIANVPVLTPSASGYLLSMPLMTDDPVMLLISERGLTRFKESYTQSDPDSEFTFSFRDAVALTGFGAISTQTAEAGSMSMQSVDGLRHVSISDSRIRVQVPDHTIDVGDSHVEVVSATQIRLVSDVVITGELTVNGEINADDNINVASNKTVDGVDIDKHRHGGVQTGGGMSLPPT